MTMEIKSLGHICWARRDKWGAPWEYYRRGDQVHRADMHAVLDMNSGARIGRWVCSWRHFVDAAECVMWGFTASDIS